MTVVRTSSAAAELAVLREFGALWGIFRIWGIRGIWGIWVEIIYTHSQDSFKDSQQTKHTDRPLARREAKPPSFFPRRVTAMPLRQSMTQPYNLGGKEEERRAGGSVDWLAGRPLFGAHLADFAEAAGRKDVEALTHESQRTKSPRRVGPGGKVEKRAAEKEGFSQMIEKTTSTSTRRMESTTKDSFLAGLRNFFAKGSNVSGPPEIPLSARNRLQDEF